MAWGAARTHIPPPCSLQPFVPRGPHRSALQRAALHLSHPQPPLRAAAAAAAAEIFTSLSTLICQYFTLVDHPQVIQGFSDLPFLLPFNILCLKYIKTYLVHAKYI